MWGFGRFKNNLPPEEGFLLCDLTYFIRATSMCRIEHFRTKRQSTVFFVAMWAGWVHTAGGASLTNSNSLPDERGWLIPFFFLSSFLMSLCNSVGYDRPQFNGTRRKPSTGRLTALGGGREKRATQAVGLINKTQTYLERIDESSKESHNQSPTPNDKKPRPKSSCAGRSGWKAEEGYEEDPHLADKVETSYIRPAKILQRLLS